MQDIISQLAIISLKVSRGVTWLAFDKLTLQKVPVRDQRYSGFYLYHVGLLFVSCLGLGCAGQMGRSQKGSTLLPSHHPKTNFDQQHFSVPVLPVSQGKLD